MEIRINVDEKFIEELKKDLSEDKATDVTREALSLLRWVVSEKKAGRVILSAKKDGEEWHRLAMPALDQVKPTAGASVGR